MSTPPQPFSHSARELEKHFGWNAPISRKRPRSGSSGTKMSSSCCWLYIRLPARTTPIVENTPDKRNGFEDDRSENEADRDVDDVPLNHVFENTLARIRLPFPARLCARRADPN